MEKVKIWPYVIAALIGILVGMGTMDLIHRSNNINTINAVPDTSFSRVKLDSMKLSINQKDTTIYKLNIKMKDDVENSYQLGDSASIALFKRLASGTSQTK